MSEREGAQILLPVPPSLGEPSLIRQRKPDVVYVYRGVDEGLLGYVLRWEARDGERKTFLPATAWRGEDGVIRWQTKSWPKPAPLYHLDHLASAEPETVVLLTEGEKTADAVASGPLGSAFADIGIDAIGIAWPGGVRRAKDADFSVLKGRDVIVLPDADEPGAQCVAEVATILKTVGLRRLRCWSPPPGLPDGWDIADPVPEGFSAKALVASVREAPDIALPRLDRSDFLPSGWLDLALPEREWLFLDMMSTTCRWFIVGETGVGKTLLMLDMAFAIALGRDFLGWPGSGKRRRVMYLDGELPAQTMLERVRGAVAIYGSDAEVYIYNRDRLTDGEMGPLNSEPGHQWFFAEVERIKADVVIFDSVMVLLSGDIDAEQWQGVGPIWTWLRGKRIAQVWLHHPGHDTSRSYGDKTREWVMDLTGKLAPIPDDPGGRIRLEFKKTRLRTPETAHLFQPLDLVRGPDGWTTSPAEPKPEGGSKGLFLQRKFLDALDHLADAAALSPGLDGKQVRKVDWDHHRNELVIRGAIEVDDKGNVIAKDRVALKAARDSLERQGKIVVRKPFIWRITSA